MHSDNPIGYSDEDLRHEINNGARLIIFPYTISIVAIMLRRNSRPYVIHPGRSIFLLQIKWFWVSFLFGWWGIPYGLINTPKVIWKTLQGGIDLTDAWAAEYDEKLRQRRLILAESDKQEREQEDNKPSQRNDQALLAGVLLGHISIAEGATTAREIVKNYRSNELNPSSLKRTLMRDVVKLGSWILAILVLAYLGAACWFVFSPRPVAFVSGLQKSYTVIIDGEKYDFPSGDCPHFIVKLSAGTHDIQATLPNGTLYSERIEVQSISFWEWMTVVRNWNVVNPDKLAVIYQEPVMYGLSHGSAYNSNVKKAESRIFFNVSAMQVKMFDDFFSVPPDKIELKSSESAIRSHIDVVRGMNTSQKLALIRAYGTAEDVAAYSQRAKLFENVVR